MKLGFGIHTSVGVNSKTFLILEEEIKQFMIHKNYGEDVLNIIVGVCCMAEEFENFYKKRRPKFTDYKEIKVANSIIKIVKTFEYQLWLNYKEYQVLSDEDQKKYFGMKIIDSLINLDDLPKKIKDFDKAAFKADLENYFTGKN